ncbi:TetR/AcrR family transcriptional regulator [Streptomyces sp. KR55]|uniref:TetR/AcrR family transcriptional regulator n=1 Tax=Streptomyces sp. KR55 TaxID=3457425 RepID=UPI003FD329CD
MLEYLTVAERGSRTWRQKRTLKSILNPATVRTGNLANVAEQARDKNDSRLTERGRVTRERILRAAADMMYVKGVSSTTLDEVRAASGTSKSQLYRHYPDKDALVRDVVALQAAEVLERHHQLLRRLNSFRGLERWRDALIERSALRNGAYGCQLGSLASELADQDEEARRAIARYFDTWEGLLEAGLERMKDSGVLSADADAGELATGLMAALQGGYLLAQTAQDVKPMRIALDMAIGHVKAYAVPAEDGNPPEGGAGGR